MTQNLSTVYQFLFTGSGQFLPPGQIYLSPGLAKIAPWWLARRDSFQAKAPGLAKIAPWCLARRDSFQAKAPGLIFGVTAPPTLTAPTRCRYGQA